MKPGKKALIEGQNNFEKEINDIIQGNDWLKKLLGKKDLEITILKGLIKKANLQLKIK